MPGSIEAGCGEIVRREIAAQHECGDARDIGLECNSNEVVHHLEVIVAVRRYAEWDFERRAGSFRFAGDVLDSPFNLTNVFEICVEFDSIARSDASLERRNLVRHRIEDAAGSFSVDNALIDAGTVAEQAFEGHARIDFRIEPRR